MDSLRRVLNWYRRVRGYCLYCENHRNQDATLCDLHLELMGRKH